MMIRSVILVLAGILGISAQAQSLVPEPAPRFRFGIPIPQVGAQPVRKAVLVDYEAWLADSGKFQGDFLFHSARPQHEQVMFTYGRGGKVLSGSKIFPYGDHINADWEQTWHYDSLGRLDYIHAHYLSKGDGTYVYPDSTAFHYDAQGRLAEVLELKNYRATTDGVTAESGSRTRYAYLPSGLTAAREKCRLSKLPSEGLAPVVSACKHDSVDFDAEGRIRQVRWIQEAFLNPELGYPPEVRYGYDEQGRLEEKKEYSFGTEFFHTTYSYDEAGRLESEVTTETRVHNGNPQNLNFRYRADGLVDRIVSAGQGLGGIKFDYKVVYEFY